MAAKIYDKRAILANGLRAKTNFTYKKRDLDLLLKNEYDLQEFEMIQEKSLG